MKNTAIGVIAVMVLAIGGCEDILEVPDISNETVAVLAPTEGSVLTTNEVSFNWEEIEEATLYQVQVATPSFVNAAQIVLDSVIREDTLGNIQTQINQDIVNGSYQWRVKALNSGFETGFTLSNFQVNGDENIDLVPPNTPQLTAPANGVTQTETQVSFSWTRNDVPGTAERDSIFIFSDEALQTLTTKALGANKTFTTSLSSGTFHWFVRAYDAAGNESNPSTTFNFTIEE